VSFVELCTLLTHGQVGASSAFTARRCSALPTTRRSDSVISPPSSGSLISGTSLVVRGTQARLAERFGVSQSTISDDVRAIFRQQAAVRSAPCVDRGRSTPRGPRPSKRGSRDWSPCNQGPLLTPEPSAATDSHGSGHGLPGGVSPMCRYTGDPRALD